MQLSNILSKIGTSKEKKQSCIRHNYSYNMELKYIHEKIVIIETKIYLEED